jgi:hypothetical protein
MKFDDKSIKLLCALMMVVMLFVMVPVGEVTAATPIYVRPDGDDTWCDGTTNDPYPGGETLQACAVQTIQRGVSLVDPSGVVNIAAGSYSGAISITKSLTLHGASPGTVFYTPGATTSIDVADGALDIKIENLDIDGTGATGPAINFPGAVGGVRLFDNHIHDFSGSAIYFTGTVTEHYIQGNMFMSVGAPAIFSATTPIDASYNSWGANAAPDLSGSTAVITAAPYTYVDMWVESSGALSGDQVEKGQTITYTVYTDMTEITGAEFKLVYPTSLLTLVADSAVLSTEAAALFDPVVGTEVLDDTTAGEIWFGGITQDEDADLTIDPLTTTNLPLFSAQFTAVGTVPTPPDNTDVMDLIEIDFAMTPADPGYSQYVYPVPFTDGSVTVVDLPTLNSTDIGGWDEYYLVGDAQEFSMLITNPATGGTFANAKLHFDFAVTSGISSFRYFDGAVWSDVTLTCTTSCVGVTPTFSLAAGVTDISKLFEITFSADGIYPVVVTLLDADVGDALLATYDNLDPIVFTKPTISSDDIVGPYTANVDQEFTLAIDNVDLDMAAYTPIMTSFNVLFDFPSGTVITYSSSDHTCDETGCELIWISLSGGSNSRTFTVNFPGAYSGPVSATLVDVNSNPDRSLATNSWIATIYSNNTLSGTIRTQGRTNWGGITMTLDGTAFDYTEVSLDQTGSNIFFTDVADGTYVITVIQARYLDVTAALNKTFVVPTDGSVLPLLYLYGGDADDDNAIDIGDASIIGGTYGDAGDLAGDVNFDGVVNLQDLALVGGNYGLTSATAYSAWLP